MLSDIETTINFNDYFSTIGSELAKKILSSKSVIEEFMPVSQMNSAFSVPTDLSEIINIIRSLKMSNSTDHDDIATKIVKASCHLIAPPLVSLVNNSLKNSLKNSNSIKNCKSVANI